MVIKKETKYLWISKKVKEKFEWLSDIYTSQQVKKRNVKLVEKSKQGNKENEYVKNKWIYITLNKTK